MKYLTKEWYMKCQEYLTWDIEVCDSAAVFSEKAYRELYRRRRNEWIQADLPVVHDVWFMFPDSSADFQ